MRPMIDRLRSCSPGPLLLAACLALLVPMTDALAQSAAAPQLRSIDVTGGSGDRAGLRLKLSGPAPAPSEFTVADPARLAIDLPNTTLAPGVRYQRIGADPIEGVTAAADDDKTRVVIELTRLVGYRIERRGNELLVHFGGPNRSSAPVAKTARPASDYSGESAQSGPATAIRNIDFRRGEQGAGRVMISLNGSNAPVDITRSDNRIVAHLPDIQLPDRLARRLDVTDFATPVRTVNAMSRGDDARIVITPRAKAEFDRLAYQTGNNLYIELKPLTRNERKQREQTRPQYSGKKISLSFQNIDIGAVLQIIAEVANINMVVSDSVSGDIALQLDDVPWDQALDIILDARGLGMTRSNNVITVAPLTEIAKRQQDKAAARESSRELAPLHSEIIQINYGRAADFAGMLQSESAGSRVAPVAGAAGNAVPAGSGAGSDNDYSLLSPRGHVTVDDRTNSLLITDTREQIEQVRHLIDRLDIPVRQVLISSRIVVANREFSRNLGVSQTGVDNSRLNSALSSSPQNSTENLVNTNAYNANNGGYAVNLPVTGATSILSTSIITDTFSLNLELSAMESENNGEIISSPRVITADGQEAKIEQGQEIPYKSSSDKGTNTEFKEAVLSLNVTPQITPNGKVIMNLTVTQDKPNYKRDAQEPPIDTRSLTTQLMVDDGDTVVLGGIFEQNNSDATNRVPFISKIPLLGALFRGHSRRRDKRELLIFVTPRILDKNLTVGRR